MTPTPEIDVHGLPDGWTVRAPSPEDVRPAADLLAAHQLAAKGSASVDVEAVEGVLVGQGSWTRRQVLLHDAQDRLVAWATVHDRAAGRTLVEVTVAPDLGPAVEESVAGALFDWCERVARLVARGRGLSETLLDSGAYADDERQQRWLAAAGYRHTRTWLQMTRPVSPEEARPGVLPEPREGVTVRLVATHEDGVPVAEDLRIVHEVLEQSFVDHFNSYRESFPEFVQRQLEAPGHRWDHWWIADVETDGVVRPGGALVSSVLPEDAEGFEGSYVDYIGVHRNTRGRGVAKALLYTVIADAARRGDDRVGLEVDADSPTGADGLYASLGWRTTYRTQSWNRTLAID